MTTLQSSAPTFDDVWRTIQELALMIKETDLKFQETDRKIQEISEQIKETNLRLQETDRWVQAGDRQLGEHGNLPAEFEQEMQRSALIRLFEQRQLQFNFSTDGIMVYDDNGKFRAYFDRLLYNTDTAVALLCQSRLSQDDVDYHLEQLAKFKDHFPGYSKFTVFGAVAATVLPDEVVQYAYRKGLFVLAQSGNAVKILNDDAFKPHEW